MRNVAVLLTLCLSALAQEEKREQVDWIGDWEQAFKLAKETDRAVMVCINSKDGEVANERTASGIYRDAEFVAKSREFVMVVVSTHDHSGMFGHCKRFGRVTCQQHVDCWKSLRSNYGEQFFVPGSKGEMISPQHAWFTSDGKLLFRKEYELKKADLMKRMQAVLDLLAEKPGAGEDETDDPDADPTDLPLSDKDKKELDRAQAESRPQRRAAIGNLLGTGKRAAVTALVDLLLVVKKPAVKCDIIRGLGRAQAVDARETIERFLDDKDELVRSFSAVALEQIEQPQSVAPLVKRVKKERDTFARKNMYRALGRCGGPTADKDAAKALLKAVSSDKQMAVRKHAAVALRSFANEAGRKLVKKRMESLASREKNRFVRGAIVYSLAYVGERDTTLPIFEKLLAKSNNELSKGWMRDAIKVLTKRGDWRWTRWLWDEDRDDPARERDE